MKGHTAVKAGQDQGIEYTIYTFDHAASSKKNSTKWQKKATFHDMAQALNQAEKLYEQGQFQKVEVKQKYFDAKQNRNVDTVLRVYEYEENKSGGAFYVLLFAMFCGLAAFGITYYLGR